MRSRDDPCVRRKMITTYVTFGAHELNSLTHHHHHQWHYSPDRALPSPYGVS
jgi:hypothetical protein